jgi:hypothetical protein
MRKLDPKASGKSRLWFKEKREQAAGCINGACSLSKVLKLKPNTVVVVVVPWPFQTHVCRIIN